MSTTKWLLLIFFSAFIGTMANRITESINIWLSRGIGCLVAVIVAILLYRYFNKG
ncbi:hypothetical protein [Priestia koreensis]|uniref:hypothetical protein n=1 Tax=Priestia koreensis TaxID=284581 RepID=UPI001F58E480|nr:hypothetical protein [Priestia koreensis]MCM3003318.1 hypothetical protein [Priestia koreensis]UNL86116.1 hypothetical protein IE339_06345 [Priestia koreensis]